jgi:hypothetical protein
MIDVLRCLTVDELKMTEEAVLVAGRTCYPVNSGAKHPINVLIHLLIIFPSPMQLFSFYFRLKKCIRFGNIKTMSSFVTH